MHIDYRWWRDVFITSFTRFSGSSSLSLTSDVDEM